MDKQPSFFVLSDDSGIGTELISVVQQGPAGASKGYQSEWSSVVQQGTEAKEMLCKMNSSELRSTNGDVHIQYFFTHYIEGERTM